MYFFLKSGLYRSNILNKCMSWKKLAVILIITHWSYFKDKDSLRKLNVYKIPPNQCQVVDSWAVNKGSISEILSCKYLEYVHLILGKFKKLKRTKVFRFSITSFLCAQ